MKNVVVNARVLQKPSMGIKRYAVELLKRLDGELDTISPRHSLEGAKAHFWEQLILPQKLNGRLLWSPTGLGPIAVRHQVLTIHDVSFLDHPEWYNWKFSAWYSWITPRLVRRVSKVITDSSFAKESLLRHTGINPEKVTVIPCGVDTKEFRRRLAEEVDSVSQAMQLPSKKYILSFGTLEPRKNLGRLIKAWGRIQEQLASEDIWLVVAGAKGRRGVFQEVDFSNLPPRVFLTGFVSDAHLPALYSGAIALAYVSVYEGFGLPPLEAMAVGTPSLTGNVTALPEVIGNAGLMVDPLNVDSIAKGILQLVEDENLRKSLQENGAHRIRKFNWDQCARATLNVLQSAVAENRQR